MRFTQHFTIPRRAAFWFSGHQVGTLIILFYGQAFVIVSLPGPNLKRKRRGGDRRGISWDSFETKSKTFTLQVCETPAPWVRTNDFSCHYQSPGTGERVLLFRKDQSWVPSTQVRRLSTACNSRSGAPNALFWPLWVTLLTTQNPTQTHIYTIKQTKKTLNFTAVLTSLGWLRLNSWMIEEEHSGKFCTSTMAPQILCLSGSAFDCFLSIAPVSCSV